MTTEGELQVQHTSWNLRPGMEVVPHCTVRSRLGGGTSYEVYDAVDDRLFTPIVVKVLRPHLKADPGALSQLRREIKLVEHMRHPLIVRCMHHDAHGVRPYLALEKLPGKTAEHLTAGGAPMTPARLVDLGMGLATTLHYMRYADVVHLDVIPRNVLFHDRVPRLIDFDLARTARQAASLTRRTGSPRCRAPEQCDPPATGLAGYATDIWGLGVTLHMAASATFPFRPGSSADGAVIQDQFPQLTDQAEALPAEVPPALAEVIQACMHKDPAGRPTPADVYFALQTLSDDGNTSVQPIRANDAHSSDGGAPGPVDRERFEAALKSKTARRPPRRR